MLAEALKKAVTKLTPKVLRKPLTVRTPLGFRFVLTPDDPKSVKMASGFYEREDVRLYKQLELQPGLIIDVGANIGFFSLLFARLFPSSNVHAFEPNPYALGRLRENVRANPRLSGRISISDKALGDRDETVELVAVPGAAGHAWGRIGIPHSEGKVKYDVQLTNIDRIYRESQIPVRLIKIDVEGFELEVLEGAKLVVEKYRPVIVFEVSLSFLIEQPGVYQRQLEFANRYGYTPMVPGRTGLVPYKWPYARVFNMWLIPPTVSVFQRA